jgi:hypothetical protein
MSQEQDGDQYLLGEDVTSAFAAPVPPRTAVLSIELPLETIAQLEAASTATGQSFAELVDAALRYYLPRQQPGRQATGR